MSNFETMRALRWKLDQVHTKSTPKQFVQSIQSIKGGETKNYSWTKDIILYILFFATLIAFVSIVMKFAKDFSAL